MYLDSNLNYEQSKKLFFDLTKFILGKNQPLKEIAPEAKLTQILINKNIQFSIKYIEVENDNFEWQLWDEDKEKKIMGIRVEDRDEAVRMMAEILDDISVLNVENAQKII